VEVIDMRQRLRAAIAARAGMPVRDGASALSGWAALKASGKSGIALGTTLLALGFAVGLLFESRRGTEPAPPGPAAPVAVVEAAAAPSVGSPEAAPALPMAPPSVAASSADPLPASGPKPHARPTPARAAPGKSSDAFERELALVQRAERALRNEDPALALALLAELDRQHPVAALAEERAVARVLAHCQAKEPNAQLVAERFLRGSPSSVYSERVRTLCGLD
jgi:hypothetical protein